MWSVELPRRTTLAAPTVSSPGNLTYSIGDAVSVPISASDLDNDQLSYDAENLPDGLSIDPDTGLISGTIAADAASSTPYSITVDADNGYADGSVTFDWTVNSATLTPQLANPGNQVNSAGDQVSLPLPRNRPSSRRSATVPSAC
jgi:large repetitive protein